MGVCCHSVGEAVHRSTRYADVFGFAEGKCVVFLTVKPAFLRFLIAEASGLPTTEGTRGSGAATTRGKLEPGSNSAPVATPCLERCSSPAGWSAIDHHPTSRSAAWNLFFALTRSRPSIAGTLASAVGEGSRRKVYELMRLGQLRSVKIGASRRIPQAALADFIAALTEEPR